MLKMVFFHGWFATTPIKNRTDRNPVCTIKWMRYSEHQPHHCTNKRFGNTTGGFGSKCIRM